MAATVEIHRLTGAGAGQAGSLRLDDATHRMKQADNVTQDSNNPVPAVGTLDASSSLSCWWVTQLKVTVTPATGINNLKWHCDGTAMSTGTKIKGEVATTANYTQSPITNLTFGAAGELTAGNFTGGTLTAPVLIADATINSGTYLTGTKKSVAGSWTTGTGYIGTTVNGVFCYQLQVGSTASPGVMTTVGFTWTYDET